MPASHIPEAEQWLAQVAVDLRRAAMITNPDDRCVALTTAGLHASWIVEAIEREQEECCYASEHDRQAPEVPRLRVVPATAPVSLAGRIVPITDPMAHAAEHLFSPSGGDAA
jgi:hypothetical protein